ncbi:MAG: hypothetical protein ACTH5L_00825 [Halomonas sp.]|uniref:hypothetical protein n=1 Tax=Halomonas TaxID=2745 RepID=UPI001867B9B8|nr:MULTISPECIES: hypothetical protein [Halomonas]
MLHSVSAFPPSMAVSEKAERPGMGLQRVRVWLTSREARNISNSFPLIGEVYRTERTL